MQKPWKFAFFGDSQGDNHDGPGKGCVNGKVLGTIAKEIAEEGPDFVLVAGDLVNGWFRNGGVDFDTQFDHWKTAMEPVYKSMIPVYPVRGNHENGPERLARPPLPSKLEPPPGTEFLLKMSFRRAFMKDHIPLNGPPGEKSLTYSFTHKNAFIVGLDQFNIGQHRINRVWLDRELSANRSPHVFVFSHEPAFEVQRKDNMSFFETERDDFWDSIGKAGGQVYFCGHDHLYNRTVIYDRAGNPIRQIVAGTGGRRLALWEGTDKETGRVKREYVDDSHHGYVLVSVDGPEVIVAWRGYSENGDGSSWQTYDSFSYTVADEAMIEDYQKEKEMEMERRKVAHGC